MYKLVRSLSTRDVRYMMTIVNTALWYILKVVNRMNVKE